MNFSSYSGQSQHEPLTNEHILQIEAISRSERFYENGLSGSCLFAFKYRLMPCKLTRHWHSKKQGGDKYDKATIYYHATSVLNFLVDRYQVDRRDFFYDHQYDLYTKTSIISRVYIDLNDHLAVQFTDGYRTTEPKENPHCLKADFDSDSFLCFGDIAIYHVPQTIDKAQILLEELEKITVYDVTEATLQMVCQTSSSGYYMNPIKMKKPEIIDLNLHYGDNFVLIHEALLDILQTKDSTGITMFHGPPGTGKTNYLRYLINEIKDKTIIYIPPDMINDVTRPNFLPFLMDYSNSILIIEDAESAILDRQLQNQFSTQAVSNLLNMSDGLIGDDVRQQIICTFNCDVQSIDPALRREGRLVLDYKFDRLKPENARRLCEKLDIPGHGKDINELTTLAQIYALKNAAKKRSTDNNDVNDMAAKIERLFEIKRQISNPCAHMFA